MVRALWIVIFGVALAALGAGIFLATRTPAPKNASTLMAVSLPDIAGREQALSQWQGKVVVVNFWATWCDPCREEMPEFVRAQAELGARGLQFVGIAVDTAEKVAQFQNSASAVNYPVLIGGYGAVELSRTFGNHLTALPFSIVVDRQGHVAHTQLGPLRARQLRTILDKLL